MAEPLCIMPWVHLATTPVGELQPCCLWDGRLTDAQSGPLDLATMTLSEAWNSAPLTDLRDAFLRGERPPQCSACWDDEAAGKRSKRLIENERWSHRFERATTALTQEPPEYLTLKLG